MNQINQTDTKSIPGVTLEDERNTLSEILAIADRNLNQARSSVENLADELHELKEIYDVEDKEGLALWFNTDARFQQVRQELLRMERSRKKPYFGRIDFTDASLLKKECYYIGKAAITKNSAELVVIDWRAPIASVYYESSLGACTYSVKGEGAYAHMTLTDPQGRAAWEKAAELLAEVGIPEPAIRVRNYPFELSGGMRQRVMIAIALACRPAVLIADEPTTALDVSVQAQIFRLLKDTQRHLGTAILFITHDMGSIATMADRVIVMYAGRCVESGTAEDILLDPRHPYTQGLIACIPHLCRDGGKRSAPLQEIPGMVPSIRDIGPGCAFAPRCALAKPDCFAERPPFTTSGGRGTACFRAAPSERSLP